MKNRLLQIKSGLLCTLFVSSLALCWQANAQTPVERHGQLSVQGTKIKDQCGRDAQLKGPSFFHHTWEGTEFWNANAVQWMASDWKVEIVRAAMAADPHVTGAYPNSKTASMNKVRAVVDGAIAAGIYVIIDFHAHASQQSLAQEFFSTMAQEYGSYPNVMYEIYNEPTGSSWTDLDQDWAHLKNYSRNLIATIRQHDPNNIIICPTPFYDQFVHHAADDPITVDINGNSVSNIVYTLHVYADAHRFDGTQGDWAKEALSKGLPMFVTESGATGTQYNQPRSTGINAPNYTEWNKWENWWDANGIGFCKWSLSTKDEFGSNLLPGAPANGNWNYNTHLTDEGRWNRDHFRAVNTGSLCPNGNDDIGSTTVPGSVSPGSTATVSVTYEASGNRDIEVVFQMDSSPYTNYGSTKVDVSAGSGTININVPINSNTPIANDAYQFQTFITTDGGGWSNRFDNLNKNNIDCVAGSSGNVQVRARMTNGSSDNLQLRVNNTTVHTFNISGSSYVTYSTNQSITGNVKLYFPDNGTDMEIDWLKVDGTTYQAENQGTNTSVWQNGSCGGSNSQLMHCAGHIDFGSIGSSTITVRARGNCGSETMVLEVGGSNVKTWNNVSTSASNHTYNGYTGGTVKVKFTNDGNNGCDRNLFVDYVKVDNTTYQTESTASRTGCGNTQWLWCNGNFNFGNLGTGARLPSNEIESELTNTMALKLYPNPVTNGVLNIEGLAGEKVEILTLSGKRLLKSRESSIDVSQLTPGMYIVRIGSLARQLIIK